MWSLPNLNPRLALVTSQLSPRRAASNLLCSIRSNSRCCSSSSMHAVVSKTQHTQHNTPGQASNALIVASGSGSGSGSGSPRFRFRHLGASQPALPGLPPSPSPSPVRRPLAVDRASPHPSSSDVTCLPLVLGSFSLASSHFLARCGSNFCAARPSINRSAFLSLSRISFRLSESMSPHHTTADNLTA